MEEKELDSGVIQMIEEKVRAALQEGGANREDAFDERERQLRMRELRAETLETLAKKKLPAELADAIAYTDEETCRAGLAATERAFRSAVQKAVDERLRGRAPGAGKAMDPDMMDDCGYYRAKLGM